MPPVSTVVLTAGDSTPKLPRASLILATEAVNDLYSFMDPDTDTTIVQFSRNVGITGTLNVSGVITGTISGNASTATALATARSLSMTGDVTWTAAGFDGSANVTAVGTLATVNTSTGTFGSGSQVAQVTANGKGLITDVASVPIAIGAAAVTSGTFADARVAQSTVTQYQSSLSIAETQIPVGTLLARLGVNQTVTANWTFSGSVIVAAPTAGSNPATKTYVDSAISTLTTASNAAYVLKIGDTITGSLTIDNFGYVLGGLVVGSTSASVPVTLQVQNSMAVTSTSGTQYLLMGNQDSAGVNLPAVISAANGSLFFGTGTSWSSAPGTITNNMTVSSSGNVSIGRTASTGVQLDISTAAANTGIRITGGESGYGIRVLNSTNGSAINVTANAGVAQGGTISTDGGPLMVQTSGVNHLVLDVGGNILVNPAANAGSSAAFFGHGGTVLGHRVHNSATVVNSQAMYYVSTGSVLASSSIGGLTWVMPVISTGSSGMMGYIGGATDATHTSTTPAFNMVFATRSATDALSANAIERMRLDVSGNLLIGRTANTFNNTIGIILNGGVGVIAAEGSQSSGQLQLNRTSSDGTTITFQRQNTTVGAITVTASATTYATSSDYRLKNITGVLTTSGVFIDALQPVVGTWKVDGSPFVGFLAHKFQEVSPTSVSGQKDAVTDSGDPVYQTLDSSSPEVMANVVAELQSLRVRATTDEATIATQAAEIADLQVKISAIMTRLNMV